MSECSREGKFFQSDPKIRTEEKSWRTWTSNQNIVTDEELVQNIVTDEELVHNTVMDEELVENVMMDEKIVKIFVMSAKIVPKVEMDQSIFKTGGWTILQLSNRKLFEELIEEAVTVELLVGTPSRDSVFVMHCAVTSTREGLHGMMQGYRRQHFAASNDLHEHPRGHSSWRESTRMKFMNIRMEDSKMRSERSEYMWKTRVILIHLENHFGKQAQEIWERNWMSLDMHTMLLDT